MVKDKPNVIVIGAGLAGLACALELQKAGRSVLILEESDGPGGRVRTDKVDGYLLDRGFQVYLDAYPTAGELFDLPALKLKKFEPGALVYSDGQLHRVMDIFRRPQYLFASAFAPIGNLFDKALVARLRGRLLRRKPDEIATGDDLSTADYLRRFGFSERMLNGFFRSFYGGIFLERELRTSSRMFEFTFRMFAKGSATLPEQGMGQLSDQLAQRVGEENIRYHAKVTAISQNEVQLKTGEAISADTIVVATPSDVAKKLLPQLHIPEIGWRSVTNLYFSADQSPLQEAIIALNGENSGLVNNVCALSDVSPAYAPAGRTLLSVSLLGLPATDNLVPKVLAELTAWFGPQVDSWTHLRTDAIARALPEQKPEPPEFRQPKPPLYLCGDYQVSASIEGAIISGQKVARQILAPLQG